MKGIVLAGGSGSRLWPITKGVSKQLLPVYDKPLIHYCLGTLFQLGIQDILIITTREDNSAFKRLLGDGSQYGAKFSFTIQEKPNGLAEAFIIGAEFIADENVALILGDNIFHGVGLETYFRSIHSDEGATVFAYKVADPERYGVVEFSENGNAISIEEKPSSPKSNFAIPGLYFFDNKVVDYVKHINPSSRGELEITEVIKSYLKLGSLRVLRMERGTTWLDTGTFESLQAASMYVQIIEERQGSKIACLEEIAWRNNWISKSELRKLASAYNRNPYGVYLENLLLD
jgi:glucose-1-phosphate thymidylyltransferase